MLITDNKMVFIKLTNKVTDIHRDLINNIHYGLRLEDVWHHVEIHTPNRIHYFEA